MKRLFLFGGFLILTVLVGAGLFAGKQVQAQPPAQAQSDDLIRGARLYDDWTQVLELTSLPAGNQPIWARQTTNTRSGVDTWRCVSCHGWDYQGKDGAYRAGANYTGFPGIYNARNNTPSDLSAAVLGKSDPEHDFSAYLSASDAAALASFIQDGVVDDNLYIDPVSLKVVGGDLVNGQAKYEEGCLSCHGADGQQIKFRYEGTDVTLGTLAVQDPWRFLHRTRFGTARAPEMTIGLSLGWTTQDGRDVLYYAQTFPTGLEAPSGQTMGEQGTPVPRQGGPARNLLTGILTALGAMATSLGFALLLGGALIGIILFIVWILRGRK